MNMTEKNGQPSMEEILASIRRIIAEEPGQSYNGELGGTPILLKGDGVLDDAGDFDLPAIFRASPPQTDRHTPLLGRLTDAIRSATAAHPETANAVNGVNGEPHNGEPVNGYHPGLSSLTLRAPEAHAYVEAPYANGSPLNGAGPVHMPQPVASEASLPALIAAPSSGDEPKRVMASFKDTHFLRLGGSQPAEIEPPPAAPAPQPVVAPEYVPPVVQAEAVAVAPPPPVAAPPPLGAIEPPVAVAVPPPPLPASSALVPAAGDGAPGMEDATADLLRPMLRQWLADNMPRMVEKALHIEIAESVKTPKKP